MPAAPSLLLHQEDHAAVHRLQRLTLTVTTFGTLALLQGTMLVAAHGCHRSSTQYSRLLLLILEALTGNVGVGFATRYAAATEATVDIAAVRVLWDEVLEAGIEVASLAGAEAVRHQFREQHLKVLVGDLFCHVDDRKGGFQANDLCGGLVRAVGT